MKPAWPGPYGSPKELVPLTRSGLYGLWPVSVEMTGATMGESAIGTIIPRATIAIRSVRSRARASRNGLRPSMAWAASTASNDVLLGGARWSSKWREAHPPPSAGVPGEMATKPAAAWWNSGVAPTRVSPRCTGK